MSGPVYAFCGEIHRKIVISCFYPMVVTHGNGEFSYRWSFEREKMGKTYPTKQDFFVRVICPTLGFQRFKESHHHHPSALSRSITQPWSFNTKWHCCINCRMEPAASVLWRDIHRANFTILKCQVIGFMEISKKKTYFNMINPWFEQHCLILPCAGRRLGQAARPCHEAIDQRLSHDGIEIVRFKVSGQLKGLALVSDGPGRSYKETRLWWIENG